MLIHNFKTFLRKIINQKVFFAVNLGGLTIGIVVAILAFLYTQNEFKYDKHFTNSNDTYILACNNGRTQKMHYGQPSIFMEKIVQDVPEVNQAMRIKEADENLKVNDKRFEAIDFLYVDSAFFQFFGWNLTIGDPAQVLSKPMSLTISERKAKQLFRDKDPIGQIVNLQNKFDFVITGVFKDFPEESTFKTDFIASISSWNNIDAGMMHQWGWHSSYIFIKFRPQTQTSVIEKKIAAVWNNKTEDQHCKGNHIKARLQPFKDLYLKSGEITGLTDPMSYIIGLSLVAGLILLISCFNFINLSTAINKKKSLEQNIKTILGVNFKQIIEHILFEVSAHLAIAVLFASIIIQIILPSLNGFWEKHLTLSYIHNPMLGIFVLSLFLALLLFCGVFPVIQALWDRNKKNKKPAVSSQSWLPTSKTKKSFQNSLVIIQFAIGISLIVSSIVVFQQLKLIRRHDIGFDKEQILSIDNYEEGRKKRYELLVEALKQYPVVKSVSCGSNVPADGISNWGNATVVEEEQKKLEGCAFISVDYNYFDLIGAKIIEGRDFIPNRTSDVDQLIISKTMAQALKLDHPVGKYLTDMWDDKRREIIGVVSDIEYRTIHNKNLPIAFFCRRPSNISLYPQILVKLKTDNLPKALASLEKEWQKLSPDYPFKYRFLDDIFNENYKTEVKTGAIIGTMTAVAIFLCNIGLFALALFKINTRTKEIGIRKVNGARIHEILAMLNSDFIRKIIIAFVIAIPFSWYAMHKWLQNFAYKTELSWWVFALAGVVALAVAVLTVSWQSWRAATRNPVESLRYE
jgi:putative ABC transport system permease protein